MKNEEYAEILVVPSLGGLVGCSKWVNDGDKLD